MNYTIVLIIMLLFTAALIAMKFIVNSKQMKNNYRNIDDRKLIEINVGVRHLKTRLLISQYGIFVLLLVLMVLMRLWELFYPAIILFLCLFLLREFFAGLYILTTTEIEYRKFKKDKANSQ